MLPCPCGFAETPVTAIRFLERKSVAASLIRVIR